MPPRRTSQTRSEERLSSNQRSTGSTENTADKKTIAFIENAKAILNDERTRFVVGIVLILFSIYLAFAYISYFFTGADDYSLIHSLEDLSAQDEATRRSYQNWTGSFGARLADKMIDGGFGISIVFAIGALFFIALRLIKAPVPSISHTIGHSAFWMIWSSISIGFLFKNIYTTSSFYRWGGKHGLLISDWLVSYVKYTGTALILLACLIVFLIIVDPNTVPRLKAFGAWVKKLFTPKPKQENEPEEISEVDEAENNEIGFEIKDGDDGTIALDEDKKDENKDENNEGLDSEKEDNENNEDNDDNDDNDDNTPKDSQESNSKVGFEIISQDEEKDENEDQQKNDDEADKGEGDEEGEEEKPEDAKEEDEYEKMMRELGPYDPRKDLEYYTFPAFNGATEDESILKIYPNENTPIINMEEQEANKNKIIHTLRSYGVEITHISATIGPTVTLYEIVPKEGTRISKIKNLENDIMLSLSAIGIRIIAPIPGKGTIGIEVPNEKPQIVSMHSVIASRKFQEESKMALPVVLGKTITNEVFMFDLAKTPHLLVAGATGQGKSVGLNAIITSLLYKKHPSELKFVLVDPKMVEFSVYNNIEKNYIAETPDQENPIITDCEKVKNILNSLVIEMENRYTKLMEAGCRNIIEYNNKVINRRLDPNNFLPYLVIIIDEFGDFIMQAGKEVEMPIARIAQKARAVGMHMILATQRPSANVITGIIKANVPARIAFRVGSQIDSRVILDTKGAEQLIGKGDMLYSAGNEPVRIQCAFVDTPEVQRLVAHISHQQSYTHPYQLPEYVPEGEEGEALRPGEVDLKKLDPLFKEIATYVVLNQQGSTSVLQRKFGIGYNRAGKLSDQLEAAGIVGPNKGPKGRDVLIQDEMTLAQKLRELGVD